MPSTSPVCSILGEVEIRTYCLELLWNAHHSVDAETSIGNLSGAGTGLKIVGSSSVLVSESMALSRSRRPRVLRFVTTAALAVSAAGCSTPAGIPVTVVSRSGPFNLGGSLSIIVGTSLDQIRLRLPSDACGRARLCWHDATADLRSRLLVAALVQDCAPVDSVTASVPRPRVLSIELHQHFTPGCAAAAPVLWLFSVPLSSLPGRGREIVQVQGPWEGTESTTLTLPGLP